jgi:hypothetical protein
MCRGPRPHRACRHGSAAGGLQRLRGRAHPIPNPASCRRIRPLAGSSTQIRMGAGTHTLPCPAAGEVVQCPDHPHQPLTWRLRTDKARTRRCINRAKRTTRRGRTTPPKGVHAPAGASRIRHYGGAQGNPSEVRDCHQSKQSILLRLLLAADQHVCAPGRTRTCTLRIRSKPRPVRLVVPWSIAAGRVEFIVQPVSSRAAP